jgi:CheY-like chemotaxis protein
VTSLLAGARVLVVEDEVMVSWMVQDMVSDLGCIVLGPVPSVDQALAMIAAQPIDAAVLDVNLNGQTSYPIADALLALGAPFVFSTGYDGDRVPERYRAFPVLQKPLRRSELAETLKKMLSARPGARTG